MRCPSRATRSVRIRRNKGRWTNEEHQGFLRGLDVHGRNWDAVTLFVPTRTALQIRTHSQKYFAKTAKGKLFPEEPYLSNAAVARNPTSYWPAAFGLKASTPSPSCRSMLWSPSSPSSPSSRRGMVSTTTRPSPPAAMAPAAPAVASQGTVPPPPPSPAAMAPMAPMASMVPAAAAASRSTVSPPLPFPPPLPPAVMAPSAPAWEPAASATPAVESAAAVTTAVAWSPPPTSGKRRMQQQQQQQQQQQNYKHNQHDQQHQRQQGRDVSIDAANNSSARELLRTRQRGGWGGDSDSSSGSSSGSGSGSTTSGSGSGSSGSSRCNGSGDELFYMPEFRPAFQPVSRGGGHRQKTTTRVPAVGFPGNAAATGIGMRSSASWESSAAWNPRSSGKTPPFLSLDSANTMSSCPTPSATARSGDPLRCDLATFSNGSSPNPTPWASGGAVGDCHSPVASSSPSPSPVPPSPCLGCSPASFGEAAEWHGGVPGGGSSNVSNGIDGDSGGIRGNRGNRCDRCGDAPHSDPCPGRFPSNLGEAADWQGGVPGTDGGSKGNFSSSIDGNIGGIFGNGGNRYDRCGDAAPRSDKPCRHRLHEDPGTLVSNRTTAPFPTTAACLSAPRRTFASSAGVSGVEKGEEGAEEEEEEEEGEGQKEKEKRNLLSTMPEPRAREGGMFNSKRWLQYPLPAYEDGDDANDEMVYRFLAEDHFGTL